MTCEKCGSTADPATEYRSYFVKFNPYHHLAPCWYDRCPNGEHLHRTCVTCGYQWTDACVGQVLGPVVTAPKPPAMTTRAPWWKVWA